MNAVVNLYFFYVINKDSICIMYGKNNIYVLVWVSWQFKLFINDIHIRHSNKMGKFYKIYVKNKKKQSTFLYNISTKHSWIKLLFAYSRLYRHTSLKVFLKINSFFFKKKKSMCSVLEVLQYVSSFVWCYYVCVCVA